MSDNDSSVKILRQLRGLGVQVALDDFGTGYSSLNYLQSFPIDRVKIDASFIRQAVERDVGIVHAIVAIASSLGLSTTAEGIETEAQFDLVRARGCDEAQGYLFSRPLPADEVRRLLLKAVIPRAPYGPARTFPANAA